MPELIDISGEGQADGLKLLPLIKSGIAVMVPRNKNKFLQSPEEPSTTK